MSNSRYGNARYEHNSGRLSLSVTLHSQPPRNRTYAYFETILKNAERLGYEIQDILYGNASLEQECESFKGVWVNLAFYRKSDTAGAETAVSIYK